MNFKFFILIFVTPLTLCGGHEKTIPSFNTSSGTPPYTFTLISPNALTHNPHYMHHTITASLLGSTPTPSPFIRYSYPKDPNREMGKIILNNILPEDDNISSFKKIKSDCVEQSDTDSINIGLENIEKKLSKMWVSAKIEDENIELSALIKKQQAIHLNNYIINTNTSAALIEYLLLFNRK